MSVGAFAPSFPHPHLEQALWHILILSATLKQFVGDMMLNLMLISKPILAFLMFRMRLLIQWLGVRASHFVSNVQSISVLSRAEVSSQQPSTNFEQRMVLESSI